MTLRIRDFDAIIGASYIESCAERLVQVAPPKTTITLAVRLVVQHTVSLSVAGCQRNA